MTTPFWRLHASLKKPSITHVILATIFWKRIRWQEENTIFRFGLVCLFVVAFFLIISIYNQHPFGFSSPLQYHSFSAKSLAESDWTRSFRAQMLAILMFNQENRQLWRDGLTIRKHTCSLHSYQRTLNLNVGPISWRHRYLSLNISHFWSFRAKYISYTRTADTHQGQWVFGHIKTK